MNHAGWEWQDTTDYYRYHHEEIQPMIVTGNNKEFELCPAGVHVARCYRLIDLGTQRSVFEGKESFKRMLLISWELPNTLMEDQRPFAASRSFTMTLGKKSNLRKILKSWRGRDFTEEELAGFEIGNVLGHPCMINIVHDYSEKNETTYANIDSVMPLPKGTQCPPAVNPTVMFDLNAFDQSVFDNLSENLQARIVQAPEHATAMGFTSGAPSGEQPPPNYNPPLANGGDFEDDIPF